MKRSLRHVIVLLILIGGIMPHARADFQAYLKKPEPAYKWTKTTETRVDGGMVYDLHLVSQTWQDITWEHRLLVFRPEKIDHPHLCVLLNTGGNGGRGDMDLGMRAAQTYGGPFAILFNIPNQPLYGGKTEDALIAYTWQKYMETGDESWPLHFPMAKAVLKAMDAVQAFTKEAGQPEITEFLITGASKRGWTTWLAGASGDPRIKAIAPMVIDTLNVAAQIPHQLAAFGGKPSEQIADYTRSGFLEKLKTREGQRLLQLEDPYSYRDRLTLPKLIILGTNDRYWAQDALNLYWNGLKGPKWVLYNPNVGHGLDSLEAQLRVLTTIGAFAGSIAEKQSLPKLKWDYKSTADGVDLVVSSDVPIRSAKLWRAASPTHDSRDAKWTSEPMTATEGGFTGHLAMPTEGYLATFGEVTYSRNGRTFSLSTQIKILPKPAEGALLLLPKHPLFSY
jgi:PhoPQ-activated pathogenicity-related protein